VATAVVLLRGAGWPPIAGLTACAGAVGAGGVALIDDGIGQALLATAFALLAAASAFTLEEASHSIVDVTPMPPVAQTAIRAIALAVPLGAGLALLVAMRLATTTVSVPAVGLALAGNLLLGFASAAAARLRDGEPGVRASSATLVVLILPLMYGPLARRIHTFPGAPTATGGVSPTTSWWIAGGASLIAIMIAARCNRVT
jgi:hypothetical protein